MNKNLKHIKIKGTLKSRGEYLTADSEFRPYEAVTLVDSEGDEVHFHSLIISKRMDDSIDYSKEITFYILRLKNKENMAGVLYAVDTGIDKIYYPNLTLNILKKFALNTSFRMQFANEVGCALFIVMFLLVVIAAILYNWFEVNGTLSLWIGGISGGVILFYPLFTMTKRAGIDKMHSILRNDGFDIGLKVNTKY